MRGGAFLKGKEGRVGFRTTPSPVFTGDTEYFKNLNFSDYQTGLTKSASVITTQHP